jgi:hypothetical protein
MIDLPVQEQVRCGFGSVPKNTPATIGIDFNPSFEHVAAKSTKRRYPK